jgi:hypothetical protein
VLGSLWRPYLGRFARSEDRCTALGSMLGGDGCCITPALKNKRPAHQIGAGPDHAERMEKGKGSALIIVGLGLEKPMGLRLPGLVREHWLSRGRQQQSGRNRCRHGSAPGPASPIDDQLMTRTVTTHTAPSRRGQHNWLRPLPSRLHPSVTYRNSSLTCRNALCLFTNRRGARRCQTATHPPCCRCLLPHCW